MDTRGRDHGTRPRFRLAQPGQGTRASRGGLRSRGGLLALLALGLCGATTAEFGQERIRDVVNTPALLLYGGQSAFPASTANALYAIGTRHTWEANVSQWVEDWPGDSDEPEPRQSHSAVVARGHMYVFGGLRFTNDRGRYAQFNNVYRLNLKTMLWSEVICSGDIPGPRDKHTAVAWEPKVGDALMVVFGGRDPSNYLNNQTYTLNLVTHVWTLRDTPCSWWSSQPDRYIAPMYGHSAVVYDSSMVTYGGTFMSATPPVTDLEKRSGQGRALCVLPFDTWSWHCPWAQDTGEIDHTRPPGSSFHTTVMASDGHSTQMVLYGGIRWNLTTADFTVHNDVWMLNMKSMTWRAAPQAKNAETFFPWSGRYLHQAACVGREMWVVGGRNMLRADQDRLCDLVGEFEAASADSHCIFNDVIAFDLRTLRWRVVMEGGWDPYDERPRPPLHSFSMVHFTVPHPFGYSGAGTQWTMDKVGAVLLLMVALTGTACASWLVTRHKQNVAAAVQPYDGSLMGEGEVVDEIEVDPQPLNPLTKEGAGLAVVCLLLLCTTGIMQQWSENANHEYPYKVTSLVFVTEFTKMLVSLPLLVSQLRRSKGRQEAEAMLKFKRAEFVWYVVPAVFLSLQSVLSYSVVLELGAGLGQVMAQLRILFTGVVYDLMARGNFIGANMRRLTETEWVGLAVLLLAEATAAGDDLTSQNAIQTSGLIAAAFMGLASALGNLSLEAILKHSVEGSHGVEQSIWLQNLLLYCYTATLTLLLWVVDVSVERAHKNLFHGWDGKTWILLIFQVSSGQVIALVFKYLNTITYTVVQITSITTTGVLASVLFHDQLSYSFIMGCCIVSVACYMMYRKSLDSSHRPVTGFSTPRDAFAQPSPRPSVSREPVELDPKTMMESDEYTPRLTEQPMLDVVSRPRKSKAKDKDKSRRGASSKVVVAVEPVVVAAAAAGVPSAFDPSELPGVGAAAIGLDDFFADDDQDVEQPTQLLTPRSDAQSEEAMLLLAPSSDEESFNV